MPTGRTAARENRAFLGRAVRYLAAEQGIRQFLDIGTGLPTTNNVHEVAQEVAPESRVVYADNDPLVLAHARALLTSSPGGPHRATSRLTCATPEAILASPVVREVLDFSQPIALMLVAVLHFIQDEDKPGGDRRGAARRPAAGQLPRRLARHRGARPDRRPAVGQRAYRASRMRAQLRDSDKFARLAFSGLELVPPGVVLVSEWRPDGDAASPGAGRGELLRRGRPQAVMSRPGRRRAGS